MINKKIKTYETFTTLGNRINSLSYKRQRQKQSSCCIESCLESKSSLCYIQ